MINIEDKVHIKLNEEDLMELLKNHFHNIHDIEINQIEIIIQGGSDSRGNYCGQELKEIICEGKRINKNDI